MRFLKLCAILLLLNFFTSFSYGTEVKKRAEIDRILSEIHKNIALSQERIATLSAEVEHLKSDQKKMTDVLIQTAAQERKNSDKIKIKEDNLRALLHKQNIVKEELSLHQNDFYEVLAVLERIGITPLPAILAHPADALQAMRSAFLLGAATPQLKKQLQFLLDLLEKLEKLTREISQEIDSLKEVIEKQQEERKKIMLLLAQKAKMQKQTEAELQLRHKENEMLASKAKSFEDLLKSLDKAHGLENGDPQQKEKIINFYETHHFSSQKYQLDRPISGRIIRYYNSHINDDFYGEIIEAQPQSIVTAPADAIVVYSGLFRSYGEIIILDVGEGYYILLAGLEHSNVDRGRIVSAGEPIAIMGEGLNNFGKVYNLGKKIDKKSNNKPMLYIEFRKKGKPIDPSSWWKKT